MWRNILDEVSEEEYEQVRKAAKVLKNFLNKHEIYEDILVTRHGSLSFVESTVGMVSVDRTRDEAREEFERWKREESPF